MKISDADLDELIAFEGSEINLEVFKELKQARFELKELRQVNEHNIKGLKEGWITGSNVAFVVHTEGRVEP